MLCGVRKTGLVVGNPTTSGSSSLSLVVRLFECLHVPRPRRTPFPVQRVMVGWFALVSETWGSSFLSKHENTVIPRKLNFYLLVR